jgi:hypothetical protein
MCEPVTAVAVGSLLVGATSAGVQYSSQKQARKETLRANKRLQSDTAQAADAEYNVGITALRNRQEQETEQANDLLTQNTTTVRRSALASTRAAAMADAQARVAAGAAGVTGASVTALVNDISRMDATNQVTMTEDYQRAQSNIRTNLRWSATQRAAEAESLGVQRQNRINNVANLPAPAAPNPWVPALQIAQQGLQFADFLNTRTPNSPNGQTTR